NKVSYMGKSARMVWAGFAQSPLPFQACKATPHGDQAQLCSAGRDELDVVHGALSGKRMHGNAELLRQDLRERFAVDVVDAARRSCAQRKRLRPIRSGLPGTNPSKVSEN